jgi:tetratricopeptide (TPR) repeat protein
MEKIDPQAMELYRLLDESFEMMESKRIPEAIQALRKAIELDPNDPASHYHMGILLTENNQPREALTEYRNAVNMDPRNPGYRSQLAMALARSGQIPEASAEIKQAIAIQPVSPEYRHTLAEILEQANDYPAAIPALQKAVELSGGTNGDYMADLAELFFKAGRRSDAIQEAHDALDKAVQKNDVTLENKLIDQLTRFGD